MVASFGCVVYYCANAKEDVAVRLLNSRPSVALGNWSYSIYLWHAPTHYAVMATFAASGYPVSNLGLASARLLLLATALAVVGLSGASYQYFETRVRHSPVHRISIIAGLGRSRDCSRAPTAIRNRA